ncbi:MAG: hypothetical protein Kow0075_09620 [Salibacteraceae bacterium]
MIKGVSISITMLLVVAILPVTGLWSQQVMLPLSNTYTKAYEQHLAGEGKIIAGLKPVLINGHTLDSLMIHYATGRNQHMPDGWLGRKFRYEHLVEVAEDDLFLRVDPGFNFEVSNKYDALGRRLYTNSRGINVYGNLGGRVFFESSFYETQSNFPVYMDSVVSKRGDLNSPLDPERGAVPGYGPWKHYNTSSSYAYDYTLVTGSMGVKLNSRSYLRFGHMKEFVGFGYRSLLLSDAASPYLALQKHLEFFEGRVTWHTTWAALQSLERIAPSYNYKEPGYQRYSGRFSYLEFNPHQRVRAGIFEGSTWRWKHNSRPVNNAFYVPIPFTTFGSGVYNHILGVNAALMPLKGLMAYGQMSTNLKTSSNAIQLGVKLTGLPKNFQLTMEYNFVGEGYQYSPADDTNRFVIVEPLQPRTNALNYYQHNDMMLAHPMGVNLKEYIIRLDYNWRRFGVLVALNRVTQLPALLPTRINFRQFEVGYLINPSMSAKIVFGVIERSEIRTAASHHEIYPYISLKTNLFNRYMDF